MEKRDAHNKNGYELALHNVIRFQIRAVVIRLSFQFYSIVFAGELVNESNSTNFDEILKKKFARLRS